MNDSEYKTMSKNDKTAKLAEAPSVIKAVYSELPSYDIIVPVLLKHGVDGLREHCKLTPGTVINCYRVFNYSNLSLLISIIY